MCNFGGENMMKKMVMFLFAVILFPCICNAGCINKKYCSDCNMESVCKDCFYEGAVVYEAEEVTGFERTISGGFSGMLFEIAGQAVGVPKYRWHKVKILSIRQDGSGEVKVKRMKYDKVRWVDISDLDCTD